jgi:DNA-binding transcriptional MocR family regulator
MFPSLRWPTSSCRRTWSTFSRRCAACSTTAPTTRCSSRLAWFIEEGHLAAHVRHLRQLGRERRDALLAACERHLPAWVRPGRWTAASSACLHLPPAVPDREVVRLMREQGVVAAALSSSCTAPAHGNGIIVSYGAFDPFTIERAIAVIGQLPARRVARPFEPSRLAVPPLGGGLGGVGRTRWSPFPEGAGVAEWTPLAATCSHQRAGENR